jgi:peptide/nickel transport system substrate-binding protein
MIQRCAVAAALFAAAAAPAARSATPSAAPLRVAIPQEVANVTPYAGVPETLLELVYDKLAAPSPYLGDAKPWLARAIVPEGSDGRTWRIDLRDGVRWHDGKPFTAEDVVFTLRYYRDGTPNRWTHHVSDNPKLTTIEPLGRLSLRIRCEVPCPLFDRVTAADLVMLPAHVWRSVTQPHLYHGPLIGTGPYRVTQFAPGRFLRLDANRDYFAGAPRVGTLLVSFIRNPATAFAALRANELDLVASPVPPELVDSLAVRPGLALEEGGAPLYAVEMRINFDRPPFTVPAMRRAVALAVDPQEVLRRVALSQGIAGDRYPPPASPWTMPGLGQLHGDRKAAARILDQLGLRDRNGDGFREDAGGRPLRFRLKVSSTEPLHQRAAQVVARQLEAVGLATRVEIVDPARLRSLYSARQFDLLIAEVTPHNLADPDQLMQSILGGYLWRAGLPNPEMEAGIARWRAASTADARMRAGFALQELHSRAPATLMLYYPASRYAYRPRAYDGWRGVPGLGVFHKWSLLDASLLPASPLNDRRPRR